MSEIKKSLQAIFNEALEIADAQKRAEYLATACRADPGVRQKVEELIQANNDAGRFLQGAQDTPGRAIPSRTGATVGLVPIGEQAGDKIGRYKLLQQIGEGGCGVVYLAEQEEPIRRRVALKVIKLGMGTKEVIARFEAERQVLTLMDHPNISKVLDAGATDTGRPYFVMELVPGIKITDFCDENNLSTEQRLALFVQVCEAIQHAHQKGIIHRDIKPSNILVTVSKPGAPGCPKVIDFGIAKAITGQALTDKTICTAFQQFIGTPAYMSPEQAMMTGMDIDTRTDIYSLGVLLYELLTGKTPLDQKELLASGLDQMRRTIREKEPVRPSTRLSTMLAAELTTTARHRHTEAPKLVHMLRGDLDWVVMKALEKDPAHRYETANGLAGDVEHHLAHEPVVARPANKLYRFQKLVRRNKLPFAAAGGIVAALVIGLAAATWEYLKERKARQQAVLVSTILEQLLRSGAPDRLKGADYTVRQWFDDYAASLTNQFTGQPEVEATVRLAIGFTYNRLGVLKEAETNLRRAVELRHGTLGKNHPDTLEAQFQLAEFLAGTDRNWEEALPLSLENWRARKRLLGAENTNTLKSEVCYAEALVAAGQAEKAEPIEREVLQIRERVLGTNDYDTIDLHGTLGQTLGFLGAHAEAERHFREAMAGFRRIGYADKQDGIICVKEIALSRLRQDDPAQAVKLLEELLPRARTNLGPDQLMTLQIQRLLARALADAGQPVRAEALCLEALDARLHSKTSQEVYGTVRTQLTLGRALVEQDKMAEAEPVLQAALDLFRTNAVFQSRPELAAQAANWLGVIRLVRKAYPEAEALLLVGSKQFFAPTAEMTPKERRLAVGHIVRLYQAWGNTEQAAVWQKKLAALAPLATNR